MSRGLGSPLSFLLVGWGWLLLTSLVGLATFLCIVRGSPLPPGLRLLHVHGALVGGLLQMMVGLALTTIELAGHQAKRRKHRGLFVGLNLAALGLAIGAWLRDASLTLVAGLLLMALFFPMTREMMKALRTYLGRTSLSGFFFGLTLAGLFGCLVLGELLAGVWFPTWHGMLRLGHLHSGLLLFFSLATIGTIQLTVPVLLHRPLHNTGLGQAVLLLLPAVAAGMLTSFLLSSVHIQLVAGTCLLITLGFCCANLFRTWNQAGQPGSVAVDHLMTSLFFLFITTFIGMAVGINSLWTPPAMPYGTLHLVAYTHTAFIGFLLQAIVGGLAYALPALLSAQRVTSHKKQTLYRDSLDRIMNRGRALQISTLSFGTLGLVLVASMTWNFPLSSLWVHTATGISLGLLLIHLVLMTIHMTQAIGTHPTDERATKG
ncbi:MAG: hypothetical protein OJF47_001840 [Nitrospira sp.]|jgi:hypothetical protein|nr:MAG: hypothetical protein OJF47_001840 [Nitrospira sp.]